MNERIKELLQEAYTHFGHGKYRTNELVAEKFAELIVRECGQYLNSPEFIGRSDLDWAMVLNEHFGVEQ